MAGPWRLDIVFNDQFEAGTRLDIIVTACCPWIPRSMASRLIREGAVLVNGRTAKPGTRPAFGSRISGHIPANTPLQPGGPARIEPENLSLSILFEDNHVLAVNKPPGLVVHPAPGHTGQTLANAILYHRPEVKGVGSAPERPGIIHRLDKDTSGVLLVAKTRNAFCGLSRQFKERQVEKIYLGLAYGLPHAESGRIDSPIGRHAVNRKKMSATRFSRGRNAETFWKVRERLGRISLMEFAITTGRTHQIRVHTASIRCPIAGDEIYGLRKPEKYLKDAPEELKAAKALVKRQMLHAWRMRFVHPCRGTHVFVEAPLAEDMQDLVNELRRLSGSSD
jgi:23S rRNA pseudouridine1911/1915/1917 synthase